MYKYENHLAIAFSLIGIFQGNCLFYPRSTMAVSVKCVTVLLLVSLMGGYKVTALDNGLARTPPMGFMVSQ